MLLLVALIFGVGSLSSAVEVAHVAPEGLNFGDVYGYFVAAYNDLVVVGAPGSNSLTGTAYVYNCSNPRACNQTQVLTPPEGTFNGTYGATVAIYGTLVVIGAPYYNYAQGSSYVYDCSVYWDCQWQSTLLVSDGQPGDGFGYYAIAYEYWVLIGAPGYNNGTGASYLYNCSDPKQCEVSYNFHAADGQPGDWYGISVGLYGWLAVVGADHKDGGNGGAYVYNCSDPYNCYEINHFDAPAASVGGSYGAFLYVYDDLLYISAFLQQNATGAVYTYNCSNGYNCTWASTISAPAAVGSTAVGSQFGAFVVAWKDLVVITAQNANEGQGDAYVYNCSNAKNCSQVNYLNASDGQPGDNFGYAAAITKDLIVVTAPFHDIFKGEIYTYWSNQTSAPPSPTTRPTTRPTNAPTAMPTTRPTSAPTYPA